jgi:hypothetical protein
MRNLFLRGFLFAALSALLIALTAGPAIAQQQEQVAKKEAAVAGALGPAETLSGSIMMVDAEKKILIVKSDAGAPYNFVITPATRITAEKQRLKLADLSSRVNQRVSVRFVPTRRGNIARSVEVTS